MQGGGGDAAADRRDLHVPGVWDSGVWDPLEVDSQVEREAEPSHLAGMGQ